MLSRNVLLAAAAFALLPVAAAAEIIRHPIPGSDFPISRAVELPADARIVYLSGVVPRVTDASAERTSAAAFGGDTRAQTVNVLENIARTLADLDLTMGDVVKMQVYLVPPEGDAGMDFAGFMEGYRAFFGTQEQPNLPARSVLANPGWLVEIEVVAVRP